LDQTGDTVQIPEDLRYAENHEWARLETEGGVRVGITDYAQDALGDIVYVDLPEAGGSVLAGASFAEIESTKSVAEVYAPVSGTIVAVNDVLLDAPELVNSDPFGEGWFVVIMPAEPPTLDQLMDAAAYRQFCEG
jgi:glycine cleavage system H protein